jgi:hypothetical protein
MSSASIIDGPRFYYVRSHPCAEHNGVFGEPPPPDAAAVVAEFASEEEAYAAKTEFEAGQAGGIDGAWAVFIGRYPGVYRTEAEAVAQTHLYPGGIVRHFDAKDGEWANIYARSGRWGPMLHEFDPNPHIVRHVYVQPGAPNPFLETDPAPYVAYNVEVRVAGDIANIAISQTTRRGESPNSTPRFTYVQPRRNARSYLESALAKLKVEPGLGAPPGSVVAFNRRDMYNIARTNRRMEKYGYHAMYIAFEPPHDPLSEAAPSLASRLISSHTPV